MGIPLADASDKWATKSTMETVGVHGILALPVDVEMALAF